MLPSCAGRALGGPEKAWEWKPGSGVWAGLVTLQGVRVRKNKRDIKNRKWQIVFHLTLKSESGLHIIWLLFIWVNIFNVRYT